ncbi:hypothetical protein NPJ88_000125 [Halomonas elongata]|uniref:hypothetical protein n=1 Tax=Halomonas elongata TaxID=2746 RepID=UPI00255A9022|nr:hypothetical protein [Halomonas elongata]MDL4860728.1 hypothetical protein [Halomonas elongata]
MQVETLQNQQATWGGLSDSIEEFSDWQRRAGREFASEEAELLAYLTDQLQAEGAPLVGVRFNHPVLGLLSHMSEKGNRMQELMHAYLAIAVTQDCEPAQRLIAGQRLQPGLHPNYVAETQCYGAIQPE